MSIQRTDVLIVGLDVAGLIVGSLLAKRNYNVTFLSNGDGVLNLRWQNLLVDQKSITLLNNVFKIVDELDIHPVKEMSLNGGEDHYQSIKTIYALNGYILTNYLLSVVINQGAQVVKDVPLMMDLQNRVLTTESKNEIHYKYLIGADGIDSMVRNQITGNFRDDAYKTTSRSYLHNVVGQHIDFILPEDGIIAKPWRVVVEDSNTLLVGMSANFYDPIVGECIWMDIYSAGAAAKSILNLASYKDIVKWIPKEVMRRYRQRYIFPYITKLTGGLLSCL